MFMLKSYDLNIKYQGLQESINELNNPIFRGKRLYTIAYNDLPLAIIGYKVIDNNAYVFLVAKDINEVYEPKFLLFFIEDLIRKVHPSTIYLDLVTGIEESSLDYVGFKKKNNYYVKEIDSYRLNLDDSIFDNEGYIIYQGKMKNVRFGLLNSNVNGCGWISAYNLSRMIGQEIPMEKCAKELSKFSISGKLLGQEVFTLFYWLKKHGLPVKFSLLSKSNGIKHMKESKCGILLYTHKRGSHYATYQNLGDDKFKFYNVVYGKQDHIIGIEEFFKKYVLLPIAMVIYVE